MIRHPFYDFGEHSWRGDPYYPPYPREVPTSPLEELKRIDEYTDYLEVRKKKIIEEAKPKNKVNEKPLNTVDWMLLQAFIQPFLILGYLYFLVKILK